MMQPTLIIVSGPPGSGKTTLANLLANSIRCPQVCRDALREGLMNTLGAVNPAPGDEIAEQVYGLFFETIQLMINRQVTIVAEAAFRYPLWARGLKPFTKTSRLRILQCRPAVELIRKRYLSRMRSDPDRGRFHPDKAFLAGMETRGISMESYDLQALGAPTLNVDTSEGYSPDLNDIVTFVRGDGGQ